MRTKILRRTRDTAFLLLALVCAQPCLIAQPSTWRVTAQQYLQQGKAEAALKLLEAERNKGVTDPDLEQMLGVSLSLLERPIEAQQHFDLAIAKRPRFGPYLFSSGLAASNADNLPLAEARLAEALKADERLPRAQLEYALVLAREGKWQESRTVAASRLQARDVQKSERPLLWRVLGRDAYMQKDWPATVDAYKRVLVVTPDTADANEAVGEALLAQGNAVDGLPYLKKAEAIDPTDGNCERVLADAYKSLQDPDEELAHLQKAHDLLPADYTTSYRLSRLLRVHGRKSEADLLQAAVAAQVQTNKNTSELEQKAADLNAQGIQMEQEYKYVEALEKYEEAATVTPHVAVFRRNAALLLTKLGRYPEAISLLQTILEQDPDDLQAHQILATAEEQSRSLHR